MIVDCAVYDNGHRRTEKFDLAAAAEVARAPGSFVWLGLYEPSAREFTDAAELFQLHPLAVEDAVHAHQRPKLERYGDSLFAVLKPARYVDSNEVIEVGEIMLFVGAWFVVTVRHGNFSALAEVRHVLETEPDRLCWGPTSVLHAVADHVVDEYAAVLAGLNGDIDEVGEEVFTGPSASHGERIFKLKREVLQFRRSIEPLAAPLEDLGRAPSPIDAHAAPYFRDVHDHLMRAIDDLAGLNSVLDSALNANVAQIGMRQNEDMRKISAWVAIVAVPTMIAGVYGMNFEQMPELTWAFGYPFALGLMAMSCVLLYRNFKHRNWL